MLHQQDFDSSQGHDRRGGERLPIRFVADIEDGSGCAVAVQVMNVSRQGFMADCGGSLPTGSTITFTAPNAETFRARVQWARDGRIGCLFEEELDWEDLLGLGLEELGSDDVPGPAAA